MQFTPIKTIRTDGGTQPRVAMNEKLVNEYAEKMKDGEVFPPVVVYNDGKDTWLADGFTRYFASLQNSAQGINADMRSGSLRDAQTFAWKANNKHGQPLSNDDIENILFSIFADKEYGAWSNNKIAKEFSFSAMRISRLRQKFDTLNNTKKTSTSYTHKNGQEVTMQTTNIGKKKSRSKDDEKPQKNDDQQREKMRELFDTITGLSEENTVLKDKIAIGQWDASEIEKIDAKDTIDTLREQVRILEIDNQALRESRDMYQARNVELIKSLKSASKKKQ